MSTLRKRKKTTSTLRQRIIDEMPNILELIDNVNRQTGTGVDDDFRPAIIESVRRIAELKTLTPSQAQKAFARVEKDAGPAKLSIANLPPRARHVVEVRGLDVARELIAKETGRTKVNRKLLAAEDACDLLLDYGGNVPTLTGDGPYVRLAGLLYYVATEDEGDLEKYCKQHFDDRKRSGSDLYSSRRGPRGEWMPASDIKDVVDAFAAKERQKRLSAAKMWPPLEQVVDAVLSRSS